MNELAEGEVFLRRALHDARGEGIVAETVGAADGVEVLQTEADLVDLAVTARALRLLLMRQDSLTSRE